MMPRRRSLDNSAKRTEYKAISGLFRGRMKAMKDILVFLARELAPHKKAIAFCSGLAVLAALLDMAAPILMGRGFDMAVKDAPFAVPAAAIVGWFAIRTVADRVRSYINYRGGKIAAETSEGYVRRMLVILLDKPLSFHFGKKSQETSDKIMQMRWHMENMIVATIFDLVPALLAVVAILGYLTFVDWRIALALALSMAAFMRYVYAMTPVTVANQEAWRKTERKASSFGWDSLRNILVVKSTTNEALVGRMLAKYGDEMSAVIEKDTAFDRKTLDVQNLIIGAGSLAALLIAVADFRSGALSVGGLSAVTAYTFAIFGYVRYCQWQFRAFLRMTAAYGDAKAVMAEPAEDFASGESVPIEGNVEFRNVRFRYREDKHALEDVCFTVRKGERIAIVGESGEGKTTMVDLLGRYYDPQSGSVMIDGRDARGLNLRSLRSQMAYVPQDLTLFHESIAFNIRYGRPDATDEEVREAARLADLDAFIEGLPEKYETVVGERGLKLSGGERQRVALARAFLRDPRILVLDEPTAHLDSKTEERVRASLEKLMNGRTTFVIAHRLRTVMDADRILVLKDGRIAESGRHDELVKKPGGAYAALLEAQSGLIAPGEKHLGEHRAD